jgi:putative pyruvate formate lyase activating enzyme
MTDEIRAARAALHMWEEPCISGEEGSGTIFFCGCPLRCIYCQNRDIAIGTVGKTITVDRLCDIFFELKEKGANNINFVTPTHYALQIVEAVNKARGRGFDLPFVYNTGNYEKVETLRLLENRIDIYLPDCKYFSPELAKAYSNAPDYFSVAMKGLAEMLRQTGTPQFDHRGMMTRGIIVRHLVLPGHTEDSRAVIKRLYEQFGDDIYISIMNQYTPMPAMKNHPLLCRKLTAQEYDEVVDYAIELGVTNGFIQEAETADESFIPLFDYEGL